MEAADLTKIEFAELRDFALGKSRSRRRSVIIELGGPVPEVTLRKPTRSFWNGGRPEIRSFGDGSGQAEAMDRLEKGLSELGLANELVRLDAAQAFVASVTPVQLRAITGMPLVGVIRPNRTHRTPREKSGS